MATWQSWPKRYCWGCEQILEPEAERCPRCLTPTAEARVSVKVRAAVEAGQHG